MKKNLLVTFSLIYFSISQWCFAQESEQQAGKTTEDSLIEQSISNNKIIRNRFLALEKSGGKKRIRFYEGSEIVFKLKGDKAPYRATIERVKDSSLVILGTEIQLKDISAVVFYKNNGLLNSATQLLPVAGIGYFLMDMINPVFSNREAFVVTKPTVTTSATLILGGLFLKIFKKRTIRLNQKRYLITLAKF